MTTTLFKKCFVPGCPCNAAEYKNKIFIRIPNTKFRLKWFKAVGISTSTTTSNVFCCEDHFNLSVDAVNFKIYKVMGGSLKIRAGIVPHLNLCPRDAIADSSQFSDSAKKRKLDIEAELQRMRTLAACSMDMFKHDEEYLQNPRQPTTREIGIQTTDVKRRSIGITTLRNSVSSSTQTTFRRPARVEAFTPSKNLRSERKVNIKRFNGRNNNKRST